MSNCKNILKDNGVEQYTPFLKIQRVQRGGSLVICGIRKQFEGTDHDSKKTSPQAFTLCSDCNIVKRGWVANKKVAVHYRSHRDYTLLPFVFFYSLFFFKDKALFG